MPVSVTVAGTTYQYPAEGDTYRWGPDATLAIVALTEKTLQLTGGAFTLTADANFGANFGLVSAYFKSRTANIADAGILRLARADSVVWRNEANNANLTLGINSSDEITFNGVPIISASGGLITNANISPSAAIALSKLAALTASKLLESDGSGVIDVSTGTGYLKAASGTPSYAAQVPLATDVSGILAKANGGAGADQSSVTYPSSGTILTDVSTTKGDLLARDASQIIRLPVGTNGQVLAADSGETSGLIWVDPAAAPAFSAEASNYSLAFSSGSGALTIALKDADGSDPSASSTANFGFRSATATSGAFTRLQRDSALSLVIPSTATLGMQSGNEFTAFVGVVDDDGTEANMELVVSLCKQPEFDLQSCVAISTGADSNAVIYSSSTQTSRPIRWIGSFTITPTTAGTWDTAEISKASLLPLGPDNVSFSAINAASASSTSTITVVYQTERYDTKAAYNNSTGVFTAPVSGLYQFDAIAALNAGASSPGAGDTINLSLYVNSTDTVFIDNQRVQAAVNIQWQLSGSYALRLSKGDTVALRLTYNLDSGSSRTVDTGSGRYFSAVLIRD